MADFLHRLSGVRTRAPTPGITGTVIRDTVGPGHELFLRGDIGGFDVGSKFTWQASADIQFAFTTSLSGTLGYRALNFDYEADRADYDMTMYGPWLGVNWSF